MFPHGRAPLLLIVLLVLAATSSGAATRPAKHAAPESVEEEAVLSVAYPASPTEAQMWEAAQWQKHMAAAGEGVATGASYATVQSSTAATVSPSASHPSNSAAAAPPAVPPPASSSPSSAAPANPRFRRQGRPPLPASALGKPLVTLVMIVKNELKSLPATLSSVLGWVDRVSILDTGSSDGSDEFIERWCREHLEDDQWALHRGPFVDFSTTRNEALRLAGDVSEFILVLNGDDRLVRGKQMRAFLEQRRHLRGIEDAMYIVPIDYGGRTKGRSERISRSANHFVPGWPSDPLYHWRYEGVTHEVYVCQAALQGGVQIEYVEEAGPQGFHIFHDITYDTKESKRERFELDVALLLREIEDDSISASSRPNRARSVFYLAQSYFNLGDFPQAFRWFQHRLDINYPRPTPAANDNEKSRAAAMMASMAGELGKGRDEIQRLLLAAHAHCPTAYSSMQLARFHLDVMRDAQMALKYGQESQAYLSGRRRASMACGDDQALVRQQLPQLLDRIQKGGRKAAKKKKPKKAQPKKAAP